MRINRSSSAPLSVIIRAVAVVICVGGSLASVSVLSERVMSVSRGPAVAQAESIVLPTLTVNKLADTNDGVCDADCSLREAIAVAAPGDTISFAVTGTIGLTLGQLTIAKNLTIQGPGASMLMVSRSSGTFRIFDVSMGFTVSIEGLTVSGGTIGSPGGGGINNGGNLTLNNLVVTGNTTTASNTTANGGGGIRSTGTLTINNSTISNNGATNNIGGVFNGGGTLTLNGSIVSGNSAGFGAGVGNRSGGILNINASTITANTSTSVAGIYNTGSTMTITNSTVSSNVAGNSIGGVGNFGTATIIGSTISGNRSNGGQPNLSGGGGINSESAFLTVINSTISGNVAANLAGGISIRGGVPGTTTLTNCTLAGNSSTGPAAAGGIWVETNHPLNSRGSIIAGNTSPSANDVLGVMTSEGYNLLGDAGGATIVGGSNDILNVDPKLGPLANNGGPTQTRELLPGSPAIDRGNSFGAITDQRGQTRPNDSPLIPNAPGGDGSDIGAYEQQMVVEPPPTPTPTPTPPSIRTVTKLTDSNDGVCDADCSLREAVATAPWGYTVNFAVTGTVGLTMGQIEMIRGLTIQGPGASALTIARTAGVSRVFRIFGQSNVTIDGVTITGGNISGGNVGGAIENVNGFLTVTRAVISGNAASGGGAISSRLGSLTLIDTSLTGNSGGGIYNDFNQAMLVNCTLAGNTAGIGGGIIVLGSTSNMTIINSTIVNNSASGNGPNQGGGGIHLNESAGGVTLINSTIAGNSSGTIAGGLQRLSSGTLTIKNSIVAGNTAPQGPDLAGIITSQGYNLIGNPSGATINGGPNDILNADPMLGPLANNGGPTMTRALLLGSPAIDKGSAVTPPLSTDQRGRPRPVDMPDIPNAPGGNGSDIGAVEMEGKSAPFDFDADGKTDIGIFRPGPAEWWINRSSNGLLATQFGATSDRITPADFTGDGKTDIAFWRPSTGFWYVLRSEDFSFFAHPFGSSGDIPAPADYDDDGRADAAVFRPSVATWFIQRSTGGTHIEQFGINGDVPVVGDYDNDGRADIGIFRPAPAEWWINRSTAGLLALQFGATTDKPVQGDYTGDGKTDVAFWRPANGNWFVLRSEDLSFYSVPFGVATDIVAPGDYDGDGKHDTAVFRPSSATWFVNRSTGGTLIQPFGVTGDQPIPNAFVP